MMEGPPAVTVETFRYALKRFTDLPSLFTVPLSFSYYASELATLFLHIAIITDCHFDRCILAIIFKSHKEMPTMGAYLFRGHL